MNIPFLQLLALVIALSLDAFAASFVYGTDNVRIPFSSVAIITGLSTGILLFFLLLGEWFGSFIPAKKASLICFSMLLLIGLAKLFDGTLKALIRKRKSIRKKLCFSFSDLNFILTVYADPSTANREDISVLSPLEALSLGIALSLDSAAAGFGAGMMVFHLPLTLLFSALMNILAILFGSRLGRALVKRSNMELSWLSGLLLIALAFSKLF